MAASGSSFRPAASDSAIARDGIGGADVSHNSRRSPGTDTTRRRNPGPHPTYDGSLPGHTSASTNHSDIVRSRNDPTRIWSAPSSYAYTKQGPSRMQKSPSLPEVYRHNTSHALQDRIASAAHGTQSSVADDMRSVPAPTNSRLADSPPPTHSGYHAVGNVRSGHAHGGDEHAYWSGFEDGVQYERQREAFAQRSGESDVTAIRRSHLNKLVRCTRKAKNCR